MRLATFNLENMFDRAKAINASNWALGKPALEAHQQLNSLFAKEVYGQADQEKIIKLFKEQGLLNSDVGPWLTLRKIRGSLIKRPRSGEPEIVASGRKSWIGWVELKTEAVNEEATRNTARTLQAVAADVQAVVEAEDRGTLRMFNAQVLKSLDATAFDHIMLIDGNDERGIDVGLMTRQNYPIISMRSHIDDEDEQGPVFSRDCAEFEVALPSGDSLWVLVNHFKSKGYGSPASNNAKRKRQSKRVRALYEQHLVDGHRYVAVLGDLNDTPDSDPLSPLLGQGSTLKDISSHPSYDGQGREGTHGNCTPSGKLDYILLSPALYSQVSAAGIERRGMWGGVNGTLWPRFDELTSADQAASDHAALWVDLAV